MNQIQLPAYLQNRQAGAPTFAQRAIANVGAGAGPYISIEGGRFTFIDAAGNTKPVQTLYCDVVVIDVNDHISKDYRPATDKWDPNNPTPPVCYSDNGVAPSQGSAQPQSTTCAGCEHNVWGSKISMMGSKVKACRDTQKLAVISPEIPNQMFRLIVTPNSLGNFRAYVAKFLNAGFDLPDVVTRLSFEAGVQGTLLFDPAPNPWLDDATLAIRDQAVASKASDMLVGRLDRPRLSAGEPARSVGAHPALAAPYGTQQDPYAQMAAGTPSPLPAAAAQPAATPGPVAGGFAPVATGAAPTSTPEPQRRRRRTQAEMAAANPPAAGQQANGPAPGPALAPFRPTAPDAAPPAGAAQSTFGIAAGVAPNPELAAQIKSIFG